MMMAKHDSVTHSILVRHVFENHYPPSARVPEPTGKTNTSWDIFIKARFDIELLSWYVLIAGRNTRFFFPRYQPCSGEGKIAPSESEKG